MRNVANKPWLLVEIIVLISVIAVSLPLMAVSAILVFWVWVPEQKFLLAAMTTLFTFWVGEQLIEAIILLLEKIREWTNETD